MAFSSYAQEFIIVDLKKSLTVPHQKETVSTFSIKNYTNQKKNYSISINNELLKNGSNIKICESGTCHATTLKVSVSPNSSSKEVEIRFSGGLSNFKSSVLLKVVDLEYDKAVTSEIFLEVTDQKNDDIFYQKDNLLISNFYPNPAKEFASMEYSIDAYEQNVKIILQNVLGSVINEYSLDPKENKLRLLTENMSPGIYFYTLVIKDEGLATRKLIVKK
ncbi:T9SS type A sorting domain-containing protein [Marivirga sp. S37H4]|uniref:T9SS type A sorting domain-containing protein n=1 Tax=Marivirga aurantiaca TaxID=2802615 RepID=A0A934WVW1_9BACT|nr:T9SS type A sorting domain-containing protein [Marivirga aurantiaca]MBK6263927.1 T9SS type A sorting domain-containing protein [Marivirga aurantiaca]